MKPISQSRPEGNPMDRDFEKGRPLTLDEIRALQRIIVRKMKNVDLINYADAGRECLCGDCFCCAALSETLRRVALN